MVSCLGYQDQSERTCYLKDTRRKPVGPRRSRLTTPYNVREETVQINSFQMLSSKMAGPTNEYQGIIMYFIRCPRHSLTKMMFNINIFKTSSSMTNVEEEVVQDREIARVPQLCERCERGQL